MEKTEELQNNFAIKHTLLMVSMYEIYFLWLEIFPTQKWSGLSPLWWLAFLLKIGVGYFAYKLLISKNIRSRLLGVLIAILVTTIVLIFFYISPQNVYPIIGSHYVFFLTINSLFYFRYYKHPETVKRLIRKSSLVTISITAILLIWSLIQRDLIVHILIIITSLTFYFDVEGYFNPKKRLA
jgi:hypothetical protein